MQITSIRFDFNFEPSPGVGELWAFASLELDHELLVRRVRVVGYGDGRVRVYMPSKTLGSQVGSSPASIQFQDIVYPMSRSLRERMSRETLKTLMLTLRRKKDIKKVEQIANVLIKMGEIECQK